MLHSLAGGLLLAGFACIGFVETANAGRQRAIQPMTFALANRGPGRGLRCRVPSVPCSLPSTIRPDAPRQFLAFVRDNPVGIATVVLESDGG